MSQQKLETLDELLAQWKVDSHIPMNDLDMASIETAKLHSRYLAIMLKHELRLRGIEKEYNALFKDKWRYYNGKLSEEELKKRGWEQFDYTPGHKMEMETYYKADADLQNLVDLKVYHEKVVKACEEIIKSLGGRSYHIGNAIAFRKMKSGN
jgi:hypothetical protein